jgi:hypothetical protein
MTAMFLLLVSGGVVAASFFLVGPKFFENVLWMTNL